MPTGTQVLKPGQSISSADGSIALTFVEVLDDSRCPADAMCVWQGNVRVLLEVTQGTELQQYTLTLGELLQGDVDSISVSGSTVALVQVDPYPLASQPTDPADYEITLSIE
ncbi:MAG: hypothetical protein WD751_05135 [Anaerolineales bacterium]